MDAQPLHIDFKEIDFNPFEDGREIDKIVSVDENLREIWLSCILGEKDGNLAYNESLSMLFAGDFDFEAFKTSFEQVVQNHEALRASVSENGEKIIIYKKAKFAFPLEDISQKTKIEQEKYLKKFVSVEMDKPFDLQNSPLFRVFMHKLDEKSFYFTFVIHHIICDGWSFGIILEDLSKLYNSAVKGIFIHLEKSHQFSDYAKQQADFLKSDDFKKTENFWLDQFKGDLPVLNLPIDFPRPTTRTYRAKRFDLSLPVKLIDQLKETGAKTGNSLSNIMLAAFDLFLFIQTNQTDLIVGLPAAGQSATDNLNLVGHCVNLLPIRSKINPETPLKEFLKERKTAFFDAYEHQQFSFGQLVKKLNIKRDPARVPLVSVIFNIDMGMDSLVSFDDLTHKLISNARTCETFEIFLNATGSAEDFILEWTYNTQLFKSETIEKMANEFRELLDNIVLHPEWQLKEFVANRFSTKHAENAIAKGKSTEVNENVLDLFNHSVQRYPDKIAVEFEDVQMTYQALNDQVNQFSNFLIKTGVKKGSMVGLAINRSLEMLVAILAVLKSGAAYLPLDPTFPSGRLNYMVEDSGTSVVLVSKTQKNIITSSVEEIVIEEVWPLVLKQEKKAETTAVALTDFANLFYTSGSTGKPKGVKITHKNLANFLLSMQEAPGIKTTDRLLTITSISFDPAGLGLFLPLISGAQVIIANAETIKDGRLLVQQIAEKEISFLQATPSSWQMILDSGLKKPPYLKALCGGEALTIQLATHLLDYSTELWNIYGPTETTVWSCIKQILPTDQEISIGNPINNMQFYILGTNGELLPRGEIGEIGIAGFGVAEGYLNRPELSTEKFVENIYDPIDDGKIFKSGDLGKMLPSGEIQCFGRIDHQVKIRGHRIELGEIEAAVSEQSEVKQAVVVANRNEKNGSVQLVAYVTIAQDVINESALHAWVERWKELSGSLIKQWKENLTNELPTYMIPDHFIGLQNFPLTPTNKVDRKALPELTIDPSSETSELRLPQTENEALILKIWSDVLGLEKISITDDFFEIGGHSLLAVKVMVEIERATGKRLPLATLFTYATIEKLAQRISDNSEAEQWEALVPIKTNGTKTPVFLIHGAGLNILLFKSICKYFDEQQPIYGIQALGLNYEMNIPSDLKAISTRYLTELLKVNPNGPYCLAGYSLGGFIAFEMANQLREMGKEITFLGIMDTYVGTEDREKAPLTYAYTKIKRQFNKLPFVAKTIIEHPSDAIDYQLKSAWQKFNKIFEGVTEEEVKSFSAYERTVYDQFQRALMGYSLVPSKLKIHLFRVEKRLYYLDDPIKLGWDKYALDGVEIHEVPGDHKTFLSTPNDKRFAEIFQQVLDNVD
ncbi:amino acid adenylation domain-containing protein [Pedobacter sp. UYP30]|uniref:non-ribosomal peptide synthetase n=1 Tax=Pedobacter sp. UYP30 TaxID=1756400 RepID=UPI00339853DF